MRTTLRLVMSGAAALTLAALGCSAANDTEIIGPEPPNNRPSSVTVSAPHGHLTVGDTVQLTGTALDSRGQPSTGAPLAWKTNDAAIATVSSSGLLVGVAAGQVVVSASSGEVRGSIALTVLERSAPPPPSTSEWTYCTRAGTVCEFIGLRDVRLGAANGPYLTQTAFHLVPCTLYDFGDRNPAPGQDLHCEYGPIKLATLTNPMPGMGGLGAKVTVPLGSPGVANRQVRATSDTPVYTDGSGSFRTTCSLSNFAFDDPIVYPGQPGASHLHVFFGNTSANAFSTPQSVATTGNSTCRGGILNRTAYWAPALFDSRTGEVQAPDEGVFYYKTGYNIDPAVVRTFPEGLRMIAGNKNATAAQQFVTWECKNAMIPNSPTVPTTCPVGDAVRLTIIFPQCWDGKNLDSPDHKSHMAYPIYRNAPQRSTCPATHPVTLPEITEHFDFPVTSASAPAYWRLSSDMYSTSQKGGLSAHADWMNGWDPKTIETIVTQCLNKAVDCGVGSIGNRTELY